MSADEQLQQGRDRVLLIVRRADHGHLRLPEDISDQDGMLRQLVADGLVICGQDHRNPRPMPGYGYELTAAGEHEAWQASLRAHDRRISDLRQLIGELGAAVADAIEQLDTDQMPDLKLTGRLGSAQRHALRLITDDGTTRKTLLRGNARLRQALGGRTQHVIRSLHKHGLVDADPGQLQATPLGVLIAAHARVQLHERQLEHLQQAREIIAAHHQPGLGRPV